MSEFVVSPRYSCTLGGALGVVRALPGKVIPIIHAAPGCGGNLGYAVTISSGYAGGVLVKQFLLPALWRKI